MTTTGFWRPETSQQSGPRERIGVPLHALPAFEVSHDDDHVKLFKTPRDGEPSTALYNLFMGKMKMQMQRVQDPRWRLLWHSLQPVHPWPLGLSRSSIAASSRDLLGQGASQQ